MPALPLHIAPDHPAFAGHFPGMPIVPGVVLLDEAIFAIARHAGLNVQACQISSVKFLSPVTPDTGLLLQYAIRANGTIQFDILCNNASRTLAVTGIFDVGVFSGSVQ